MKKCCTYANSVLHATSQCGAVYALSFTRSIPHLHLFSSALPCSFLSIFFILHLRPRANPCLKINNATPLCGSCCRVPAHIAAADVSPLIFACCCCGCCCCVRSPTRVGSCGVISFDYMPRRRRAITRPSEQVDSTAAQIKWQPRQTQAKAEGRRGVGRGEQGENSINIAKEVGMERGRGRHLGAVAVMGNLASRSDSKKC